MGMQRYQFHSDYHYCNYQSYYHSLIEDTIKLDLWISNLRPESTSISLIFLSRTHIVEFHPGSILPSILVLSAVLVDQLFPHSQIC